MQQPPNAAATLTRAAAAVLRAKLAPFLPEVASAVPLGLSRHLADPGALRSFQEVLEALLLQVGDAFLDVVLFLVVDAELDAAAPVEVLEDFFEGEVGAFVEDDELEEEVVALAEFVDFARELPDFVDPGFLLRLVCGSGEELVEGVGEVREFIAVLFLAGAFDFAEETHSGGSLGFLLVWFGWFFEGWVGW